MAPTVSFEGPTTVAPGSSATYQFFVRSQSPTQTAAGLDIAVSGGELMIDASQGARIAPGPPPERRGEITHNSPKSNVEGVASWEFTWTAPTSPGSVTMFGAGNSVNLNGQITGDRGTGTMITIEVAAVVDTPTPSPTPTEPSGDTPTPTATSGPIPCVGDCDGGGSVVVNELVLGVNIALDRAAVTQCESFDVDDSNTVSVNELVSGVNALLRGCTP
jgi:hypothetical protein